MLKKYKPITPSLRHLITIKNKTLSKIPLIKTCLIGFKNHAGKNNSGKITILHKGSLIKKLYRKVNFLRNFNSKGIVLSLEYDPNRNAHIASIFDYLNQNFYYIIKPKNLKIGSIVNSGEFANIKTGHALKISRIPVGTFIHNISIKPKKKAELTRSAGTFSQIIEKNIKFARIKLPSNEQRYVSLNCIATIGLVSNEEKILTKLGKAGRNRWLNKRPKVRGVAMNPIDHPHGGGEGKTSGGRTAVTPWGKPNKYKKTSNSNNKLIIKQKND